MSLSASFDTTNAMNTEEHPGIKKQQSLVDDDDLSCRHWHYIEPATGRCRCGHEPNSREKAADSQQSLDDLSFGACYHGDCRCWHYTEAATQRCQCGHERSFHAPNSLAAWKKLEYPATRLKAADANNSLANLTNALSNTSLSASAAKFPGPSFLLRPCNTATTANPTRSSTPPLTTTTNLERRKKKLRKKYQPRIKDVLQFLYDEGHFASLNDTPHLSSLTDVVLARFFRHHNPHQEVQAALELIDALWIPQARGYCINQSFATLEIARQCFRALDRTVLRTIRVLNVMHDGAAARFKLHVGQRDCTLMTVGSVVLKDNHTRELVRSKIPNWGELEGRAPSQDTLKNYIMEQEWHQL